MSTRLIGAGLLALAGVLLFIETGMLLFAAPLIGIGVLIAVWGLIKLGIGLAIIVGLLYLAFRLGLFESLLTMV